MVEEYLKRGWLVIATARANSGERLRQLASTSQGRLMVETLDVNEIGQVKALRARLATCTIDLLFVNAGVKNEDRETIADVSTDEFIRIMVTNALSPMQAIETLQDLVPPSGTMGGDVLRARQRFQQHQWRLRGLPRQQGGTQHVHAQLCRTAQRGHAHTATHGTGLGAHRHGGPAARLGIEESIPNLVNTIAAYDNKGGLHYLDHLGRVLPC